MVESYASQVAWEIIEKMQKMANKHGQIWGYEIDDIFINDYRLCPRCYSEMVDVTEDQSVEPGTPTESVLVAIVCSDCGKMRQTL